MQPLSAMVSQLQPMDQIPSLLFTYGPWAKNDLYILNGWKKDRKKETILWHIKII